MNKSRSLPVDLAFIEAEAERRLEENDQFRQFVRAQESSLDQYVQELNDQISSRIDCTECGNCCRSLMINVSKDEALQLAQRMGHSLEQLKQTHLEESLGGQLVINTIPCHFLEDSKCTIYEHRFADCQEFPHLHKDGFRDRLFGILMHYGRCPIVFHVIENLKKKTNFKPVNILSE